MFLSTQNVADKATSYLQVDAEVCASFPPWEAGITDDWNTVCPNVIAFCRRYPCDQCTLLLSIPRTVGVKSQTGEGPGVLGDPPLN